MKKTRSTKELLIILRDNLEKSFKKDTGLGGMCAVVDYLNEKHKITYYEGQRLKDYFDHNKPLNALKRLSNSAYHDSCDSHGFILRFHWWSPRIIKPRINWLNQQISKL